MQQQFSGLWKWFYLKGNYFYSEKIGDVRKKTNMEPKNGLLTERMDVNSSDFSQFREILLNQSNAQTKWQKINIELAAIKIQMEDYIKSNDNREPKLLGDFLKLLLDTLHIRQNKFARYINVEPSNLNKVIKGERHINTEIALKIAIIFEIDPLLLLEIQVKNDLLKIVNTKSKQMEKYSLKDLIQENGR